MEELQVIETTSGRQFKPWASKEDVQTIELAVEQALQDLESVSAVVSEITSGKQAIAEAINAKGGTADPLESFQQLAQAVEDIPNYNLYAKLAGIIAGGNSDKSQYTGHNENAAYGSDEIIDDFGAFKYINIQHLFQRWDNLKKVKMPALISMSAYCFKGSSIQEIYFDSWSSVTNDLYYFDGCSSLKIINAPSLYSIPNHIFDNVGANLIEMTLGSLSYWGAYNGFITMPKLRNFKIGSDSNANINMSVWTATSVIAEGQSGIDELNSNLYNNLLTKLYDHSNDGVTRTLRIGWLARVTAENIAYANAKGWTLTT